MGPTEDKIKENSGLYARLNLPFLEVLKENEIHLINIEEVKKLREGVAQNSTKIDQEHLKSMHVRQSLSVV